MCRIGPDHEEQQQRHRREKHDPGERIGVDSPPKLEGSSPNSSVLGSLGERRRFPPNPGVVPTLERRDDAVEIGVARHSPQEGRAFGAIGIEFGSGSGHQNWKYTKGTACAVAICLSSSATTNRAAP